MWGDPGGWATQSSRLSFLDERLGTGQFSFTAELAIGDLQKTVIIQGFSVIVNVRQ